MLTHHQWYTGTRPTRDYGISGPLDAIINIAGYLHERTPFVYLIEHRHRKPPEGVILTRLDNPTEYGATRRLNRAIRLYGLGKPMEEVYTLKAPELMDLPIVQPFRVKHLDLPACQGVAPVLRKPRKCFTSAEDVASLLRKPKTQFVMFGDTVDGQIAQAFASYFPVFCYAGQHTVVTYLCFPTWMSYHDWSAYLPADLTIYMSVFLPYESTLPSSPQQRVIEERNIFKEARVAFEARRPKPKSSAST